MEALIKRSEAQGVFLADLQNQKARFIPVKVGIVNTIRAEVLNPPLAGLVVTLGHHLLEDGTPILIPGKKPPDTKTGAEKDTSPVKRLTEEDKS